VVVARLADRGDLRGRLGEAEDAAAGGAAEDLARLTLVARAAAALHGDARVNGHLAVCIGGETHGMSPDPGASL
jgi:hypothetical protein